jgi:ABC-type glycerol-3-phosphate transport system permease component
MPRISATSSCRWGDRLYAIPWFVDVGMLYSRPTLANYPALLHERDFLTPLRNSVIVAGATTVLCMLTSVTTTPAARP